MNTIDFFNDERVSAGFNSTQSKENRCGAFMSFTITEFKFKQKLRKKLT